ncbi:NYN domain-containing protein [Cohnella cellulosilytica]|uniref:NYN domain-containing protein n=1 Tax=Cohnella cellulosilytica TaxID=986710 RepID=A0ABW2FIA1_9BACL
MREGRTFQREDVLLVDGYNMIGSWPELVPLKEERLEDARDRLLEMLSEYQGFAGLVLIVVFDAFRVPGTGKEYRPRKKFSVVYTRERETADECIERLVGEWLSVKRNVYVATSDLVEQHVVFGRGALRVSARELRHAVRQSSVDIRTTIASDKQLKKNPVESILPEEVQARLERMRRGLKDS